MYLASVSRPASATNRTKAVKVASNVFALGTVSLVTDVSSEMVTAILPLYLVAGLGLGPAVFGLVDGLYTGATALLRLAGGYLADRAQRRKLVAGLGYGISAVAKAALLAAGSSLPGIGAAIVADRAGKGLRTAPRDALITLSTPPEGLGRAFGVHRAMDSAGAFAGPLVALAVLAASGQAFDAVFVVSGCIAAIGVLILITFVRDPRPTRTPRSPHASHDEPAPRGPHSPRDDLASHRQASRDGPASPDELAPPAPVTATKPVDLRQAAALLRDVRLRALLAGAVLLGLSTIGDGFVYLLLQRREDIATGWFPLLAVGTSLAYLVLAVPLGALADRAGRTRVFLGGYAALLTVYLILATRWSGPGALVTVLLLYGIFYAATDGVLMAVAGPLLPPELRTTGLALIQTGQALAYLVSSVLFGLAWQWFGAAGAIRATVAAATLTLAGSAALLLRTRRAAA
ncbi:MFS transporter [Paractinoplanes durhamensis]|uniref:MFS transporter n=1 Tax=Paractinoplanes durhamensis TaxID=113563 RepID=A0ABQ3YQY3_9ACTN|nr:MFS transporter [Actinoplanes durhamensis]GIE00003.1 MFS transporter [Actinoplanes durhamensis]